MFKIQRHKLIKKTPAEQIVRAIVFVIFCAVAFSYLYLVFWCFYSGLRDYNAIAKSPFGLSAVHFEHYYEVFTTLNANDSSFLEMIFNSMYFSFLGPLLCIFVTSQLAYVTSKYKFFGAGSVYFIVLVVITLPIYGTQSAMYKLLYELNFLNSRLMILTSLNGFSIYYMYFYAFFKNMSWSYAEAAQIDGANDWQIYYKVMFPQTLTMFGALFLMLWITDWNSYATALIYLPEMPTLAVGIYQFGVDMMYSGRSDLLYAACGISMLPPLILFILCNNALAYRKLMWDSSLSAEALLKEYTDIYYADGADAVREMMALFHENYRRLEQTGTEVTFITRGTHAAAETNPKEMLEKCVGIIGKAERDILARDLPKKRKQELFMRLEGVKATPFMLLADHYDFYYPDCPQEKEAFLRKFIE